MFQIGTSLREARIRQGLDLVEAERGTKIRPKYLQALEEERFEILPSPTYVKGFLRAYADFLGLDGQLYVDEYNSRYVVGEEDAPVLARPRPRPGAAHRRAQRRVESNAVVLALAGIAAAAALVIVAWKWGGGPEQTIPNLGTTTIRPSPPRPPAPQPPPGKGWIRMTLSAAKGSSWLSVHRGSPTGKLLFVGNLERGKTTVAFVGPRIWVNASEPDSLVVRVNGRAARIPGDRTRPARIVVTARGILRGTA